MFYSRPLRLERRHATRGCAVADVIGPFQRLARFCAIGLVSFALSAALLATLCELCHIPYLAAFIVTFLVSCVVGYRLNGRFTFQGHADFDGRVLSRYVVVNAVLLGMNSLALPILVETLRIWYIKATIILAATNVPISYLAHRVATYRDRPKTATGPASHPTVYPVDRSTWD